MEGLSQEDLCEKRLVKKERGLRKLRLFFLVFGISEFALETLRVMKGVEFYVQMAQTNL